MGHKKFNYVVLDFLYCRPLSSCTIVLSGDLCEQNGTIVVSVVLLWSQNGLHVLL